MSKKPPRVTIFKKDKELETIPVHGHHNMSNLRRFRRKVAPTKGDIVRIPKYQVYDPETGKMLTCGLCGVHEGIKIVRDKGRWSTNERVIVATVFVSNEIDQDVPEAVQGHNAGRFYVKLKDLILVK